MAPVAVPTLSPAATAFPPTPGPSERLCLRRDDSRRGRSPARGDRGEGSPSPPSLPTFASACVAAVFPSAGSPPETGGDQPAEVNSLNLLRSMFPPLTTATTLPRPHFPLKAAATAQAPAPSAIT